MVMKVFLTNNDMEFNCSTFVVDLDRAPSNKKGMGKKKKERARIGKDKIRRDKNCLSRSNSYEKRSNPLIRYDRLETQQPSPLPHPWRPIPRHHSSPRPSNPRRTRSIQIIAFIKKQKIQLESREMIYKASVDGIYHQTNRYILLHVQQRKTRSYTQEDTRRDSVYCIDTSERSIVASQIHLSREYTLSHSAHAYSLYSRKSTKGRRKKKTQKKSGEEGQKKETCIFGKKAPPTMKGDCESFKCRESADVLASEEKGPQERDKGEQK